MKIIGDDEGYASVGDIIRTSTGEPMTVTAVSASQQRLIVPGGWEVSDDGGKTWRRWTPEP